MRSRDKLMFLMISFSTYEVSISIKSANKSRHYVNIFNTTVIYSSEFLLTVQEVSGSIPGSTKFSE
jgi:hypothetical protein